MTDQVCVDRDELASLKHNFEQLIPFVARNPRLLHSDWSIPLERVRKILDSEAFTSDRFKVKRVWFKWQVWDHANRKWAGSNQYDFATLRTTDRRYAESVCEELNVGCAADLERNIARAAK